MDPLLIAALVANLAALAVMLLRKPTGGAADTTKLEQSLKALLQEHRSEIRTANNENYKFIDERLDRFTNTVDQNFRSSRDELTKQLESFSQTVNTFSDQMRRESKESRESLERLLTEKLAGVTKQLEEEMAKLRDSNEQKLEKMRETVDEKLHGTLEKRLGESFKQVSERLEEVQRGLGEMKTLASGVGDLKRVLTNVKTRGGWGEVQLSRQIEDIMTKDQYEENVAVKPGSNERVEFAIKLPGRTEGEIVYLPIDAKFPQEDYERLLAAQESGTQVEIDAMGAQIEKVVKLQAKTIHDKYIAPPHTTDFAIMYLPTEGLFAEVLRRPGLTSDLQNTYRVLVTGPTTLMSILNSLQMGFKTLAIEKSSSEVWKILAAAKREFEKYAQVWEKVDKQLGAVQNTVQTFGQRTRAIGRSLREVGTYELGDSAALLGLEDFTVADEDIPEDAGE